MPDLVDRLIAQKQFAWQSPLLEEIRAKLERLEQCEFWARQLLRDLPAKRDWLDPDIERGLSAALEGR